MNDKEEQRQKAREAHDRYCAELYKFDLWVKKNPFAKQEERDERFLPCEKARQEWMKIVFRKPNFTPENNADFGFPEEKPMVLERIQSK